MAKTGFFLLAFAALAAAQNPDFSAERLRAHVKFLASDLMEGRGIDSRGGRLATEYLATAFAIAGARPAGDNGTYFQKVPLVGVETQPDSTQFTIAGKGKSLTLKWYSEYVGCDAKQKPSEQIDAEAVFVGHGIVAPEFKWDDFKGVDVRGKMLVLFTNEPDSNDPKFFGGRALTYYGRWTYKYEEAARHGAAGVVILHTTPTAGYGWDVVSSSWGREQSFNKLEPNQPALAFEGWVSSEAGAKLLAMSGHTMDELLKAANSRDFKPIPLGLRVRMKLVSKVRDQDTRNVVAVVPGSDPRLKNEAVVYTAHWDHFGIGKPVNGDSIYNGAVDNATGCGAIVELARAFASLPQKPRRSIVFVAVTAEEAGLLGSAYYAAHPFIPDGKTALDLNFDALRPYGRTKDVEVSGAERTTFWPQVEQIAKRYNLTISPDPHPEQGSYYRSDHFSMAKAGVPSFTVDMGNDYIGKPAGFGDKMFAEFNAKHYHQPSDEYHDDWDFSGMVQMMQFGFTLGLEAANLDKLPTWRAGDEFLAARQKSGVK